MRILFACVAAFSAGLLVGWLGLPMDTSAPRASRTPPALPQADRESASTDAPALALPRLARDAAAELDRVISGRGPWDGSVGQGVITGTVRDPAGKPVAGVFVSTAQGALPIGLGSNRRRTHRRPHEDADLALVARGAIVQELWRRRARRVATTRSDGSYALTGLSAPGYRLTAFHENYDVQPLTDARNCAPGAVVDFRARPVVSVPVEVRGADGKSIAAAWLNWTGPSGAGWAEWRSDKRSVRLPVGRGTISASAWTPAPQRSVPVAFEIGAAGAREPLVITLAARRVLTARVAMPDGLAIPNWLEFRLRTLAKSARADPESLKEEHVATVGHSSTPGRADWYDLAPGRYLIGALLDRNRVFAHTVVEYRGGPMEIELKAADPATGRHAVVKLLGPDGGSATGHVWFQITSSVESRRRYHGFYKLRRSDGSWLIVFTDEKAAAPGSATIRVGSLDYGSVDRPIDLRNPGTITARFEKPARVRLHVEGLAGSELTGRLLAGLVSERAAPVRRTVAADGTAELAWVQPGEYGLQLLVRNGRETWPVVQHSVVLASGDHERKVPVPSLHTLRVRLQGRLRRQRFGLRCADPAVGTFFLRGLRPKQGLVEIKDLGAGTYVLECGDKRVTVRVPARGVVTLE